MNFTSSDLIEILKATAWPIVALIALIYVWRSDAISRLIRISDSVDDLGNKLSDLVEAERRINESSSSLKKLTETIIQIQDDIISIKYDAEDIRDRIDQISDLSVPINCKNTQAEQSKEDFNAMIAEMELSWQNLISRMRERFGWFDARSVGTCVRSFAHGNRKGARIGYEQADEIAKLHSDIKSYRRRQAYAGQWLTRSIRDDFIQSCNSLERQI